MNALRRPMAVLAMSCALALVASRPAQAEGAPKQTKKVVGGLQWLDKAPGPTPLGAFRCDDPTFARLGPGLTAAHRPDLQQVYLVRNGIPANLSTSAVEAALRAALRTWNDEVNDCGRPDASKFTFAYRGTLNRVPLPDYDSTHTVLFGSGLCAAALHVACVYLHTDPATGRLEGWDIVLDPAFPWGTTSGPWLDVQAILTHETGHVVGLDDVGRTATGCSSKHIWLTMYACTWPGDTLKRTLALGDALGVEVMSRG